MTRKTLLAGNGYPLSRDLCPTPVDLDGLTTLGRETRKHSSAQVRKLQASIAEYGFVMPVIIDSARRVVGGWGLVLAAKALGLEEIPAITVEDLGEAQLRGLRLALNRLAEDSAWDRAALSLEFSDILALDDEFD